MGDMRGDGRVFMLPQDYYAQLKAVGSTISNSDFMRKPQHQHLKDSYCAARFAIGYERHVQPCQIWVNPKQNSATDFVLRTPRRDFEFQTVIADVPERRIGDEYKPDAELGKPYRPGRGTAEGPAWIASKVLQKVDKKYADARNLSLLVYAMFDHNGLDYAAMCDSLPQDAGTFASVWVITNHHICSLRSCAELGSVQDLRLICDLPANPDDYTGSMM